MFSAFFYLLRARGLDISMKEWLTLIEALKLGLHGSSMKGFYNLCLAVLCKSEADYDRFGQAFLEFFNDGKIYDENGEVRSEYTQQMLEQMQQQMSQRGDFVAEQFSEEDVTEEDLARSREEIEQMLEERVREQRDRKHDGGNYWIGTHGISPFGNAGHNPNGIRVGGEGQGKRAFRVAGERRFRDFRGDNTLDTRQFQVALRHLRQFSGLVDLPPTEFDVDNTIKDTANNAGSLKVRYKKPRQNTVKVLLLMDSGGSMEYYSRLCSALFQAVSKSGHFKDLKVYYFHNCVYSRLYTEPTLRPSNTVPTDWVLSNLSSEYKVILVGDAQMAPHELVTQFRYRTPDGEEHKRCGLEWLQMLKGKYPHIVWLNPGDRPTWGEYWTRTYDTIGREFPMFPLTVEGLEEAMKKLLVR